MRQHLPKAIPANLCAHAQRRGSRQRYGATRRAHSKLREEEKHEKVSTHSQKRGLSSRALDRVAQTETVKGHRHAHAALRSAHFLLSPFKTNSTVQILRAPDTCFPRYNCICGLFAASEGGRKR